MVAWRLRFGSATVLVTAVLLMLLWGCGADSDSTGPAMGDLEVATSTTGTDIDPDGYVVVVDSTPRPIGVSGAVTFENIPTGSHVVELTQVAENCSVAGQNPRAVAVSADNIAATTFEVTCAALTGDILVTTVTVGTDIDPDGYTVDMVTVGGTLSQSIGVNASVTFNNQAVGDRTMELTGLARNCSVVGQNPRTVTVQENATVETVFDVVCDRIAGDLQVNASSSGADIPSGYTVVVDSTQSDSVGANASVTFAGLSEGEHTVELTDVAVNCTVTGANPRSVSVPFGGTASTTFEVVCQALVGDLDVNTSTTGADLDPDGYTVTVAGGASQSIAINGTVTFPDLAEGDHTVELTGLAKNCLVTGANPRSVSVPFGGTASTTFDVVCQALVGDLNVNTSTTGENQDISYSVEVDGSLIQSIGANATVTFQDLAEGDHEVRLTGVASNCSVQGENPRTVTVPFQDIVETTFQVSCFAPLVNKIVFQSDQDGAFDVWVMNTNGTGRQNLTQSASHDVHADVSPDGEKIAFRSRRNAGQDRIFVMNADGSGVVQLNNEPGWAPAWSPDGTRIAFQRGSPGSGSAEIWVMNADGSGATGLTNNTDDIRPRWSRDGTKIVFQSNRDGNAEVYVMDADGSNPVNLTNNAGEEFAPDWSPDGTKIVFHASRNGSLDLFVMDSDGTNEVQLTNDPVNDYWYARWSPDGSKIAFTTNRDGNAEVYVMNADGTGGMTRLTVTAGSSAEPHWSPQ